MTHIEWIHRDFKVLAEHGNSILFEACGEICCEINGEPFDCQTVEHFEELCKFFEGETFEI